MNIAAVKLMITSGNIYLERIKNEEIVISSSNCVKLFSIHEDTLIKLFALGE